MSCKNDALIDQLVKDPIYRICRNGNIFRKELKGWKKLSPKPGPDGYIRIKYQYKNIFIQRIIYRKFKGPLSSEMFVNHKDGKRGNNQASNLELISAGKNQEHKYQILKCKANIGHSKINYQIAEQIRKYKKEGLSLNQLKDKFGLSKTNVSYIVNNRIWNDPDNAPTKNLHYPAHDRYKIPTPKWEDYNEMKAFYDKTPKGKEVDHIIPLNHPEVCGLHCQANLQYINPKDNQTKGNKFDGTNENLSWKKRKKS